LLQLVEQAVARVELVRNLLAVPDSFPKCMLEPPAVDDGLADEVEEPVQLLGRDADRPPLRRGRRPCGLFEHGWLGTRRRLDAGLRELVEQRPGLLSASVDVPPECVSRSEERIGKSR